MMNDKQRQHIKKHGTLLGRIFVGALFAISGVGKILALDMTASYIASAGLPLPEVLAVLSGIVEIALGVMLIVGWRIGLAAGALIVFTGFVTIFFHGPSTWSDPTQQIMFYKNFAIIGGLLYMMAYGNGEGWSAGRRQEQASMPEVDQ